MWLQRDDAPNTSGTHPAARKVTVMDSLLENINFYSRYYQRSAYSAWVNMGPREYAMVLITVAIFGWLLMKSGLKR